MPHRCLRDVAKIAVACCVLVTSFLTSVCPDALAQETAWTIVLGPEYPSDAAIDMAIEDLQRDGAALGIDIDVSPEMTAGNPVILVGSAERNPRTHILDRLVPTYIAPPSDPQGFAIRTVSEKGWKAIAVAGGSIRGDVHGLYWIWDRMRVHKTIPDLDVVRMPAVPIRLAGAADEETIANALRHSATWVSGLSISDLIPWVGPDANGANRDRARELIECAQQLHLKYLAAGDEFSYHPALLEEFDARLDPDDPAFWNALQAKYRRLFDALPELDGVQIRTGELTRVPGEYGAFDVMHDAPESEMGLIERYRTFVQKIHEAVVGEFDKIYFHRTWVPNTSEQHSDPRIYESIFTDRVPKNNLFLSPYLSRGDRWYYQPYNATFNRTPHNMVALLATLDYHARAGVNVFPSFPGAYHQTGLKRILRPAKSNVKGVHFHVPRESGWDTQSLTAYTVYRLAWEPSADLRDIARDYAAIHVGASAAPVMADILLLSQTAYKDGLYVKPVAESIDGNTLPQLRLTTFPVQGFPQIDRGRAHIEWLRTAIYEPSQGRIEEAIVRLDQGLDAAERMETLFSTIREDIEDEGLAQTIADSLRLTHSLVETNNRYIKTCYAYFAFVDEPSRETSEDLFANIEALQVACDKFRNAPGFVYDLYGVEQLMRNARDMLAEPEATRQALESAVDADQVDDAIREHQRTYADALESNAADATRFLRWRGRVDGRDVLHIQGEEVTVEHIQHDRIDSVEMEFFQPLPARPVTVLYKPIESRARHPFLIEQPTAENDYTAKLYLHDLPGGYGWWEIELYYVDAAPESLGLALPW